MAGIDKLISSSLSEIIKKKLDSKNLKELERRLFLKEGMSIKISIEHFQKFNESLEKIPSINKKKFIDDCMNQIIKIKKINEKYCIVIIDQKLIDLILQACGDPETRRILYSLFDNELTIPQILNESQTPKTSGYRKIENLIINGLILESGKVLSESKKISKYKCIFDEIKIDMKNESIEIQGIVNKKVFEKSTSMNILN
ncbi:MAG: transcriptional regulator [Nitrosarchaeum sp.]